MKRWRLLEEAELGNNAGSESGYVELSTGNETSSGNGDADPFYVDYPGDGDGYGNDDYIVDIAALFVGVPHEKVEMG